MARKRLPRHKTLAVKNRRRKHNARVAVRAAAKVPNEAP